MRNKVDKENNLENNNQRRRIDKRDLNILQNYFMEYTKKKWRIQYSYFYLLIKWLFSNIIIIL